MRILLCLIATIPMAACTRPAAVRSVARNALPVAAQLQTSMPILEQRMRLQRRGFAERNAAMARQRGRDAEMVALIERRWTLGAQADPLRRMAVLRDRDAAILADPLAPLAEPTIAPVDANPIPTGDLAAGIATLDRLTGRGGMSLEELLVIANAVGGELRKTETEAQAAAAGDQ